MLQILLLGSLNNIFIIQEQNISQRHKVQQAAIFTAEAHRQTEWADLFTDAKIKHLVASLIMCLLVFFAPPSRKKAPPGQNDRFVLE